ncbi:MAG: MBL fold metallo-hydrolase [Phycisphaerales bacterium]|nr:MBL fold metallo-hydrolase [Phycisphaerales bacterium]
MNWNWTLLDAGRFKLDGGSMFGVVPKGLWSRFCKPDEHNCLPYCCNCVLLEKDEKRILIESGYGVGWSDKEKQMFGMDESTILTALVGAGIEPDSIDTLILSHLHFDHAAGATLLPNAQVVVQKQEWEDALANRSTMSKTYLPRVLESIKDRVELVEGKTLYTDGITLTPRIGHTWGIQSIEVETDGGTLCFASDLIPDHHHVGLAFSMGYDMLPWENKMTKQSFLEEAYADSWTLVLCHDITHPVVRVIKNEKNAFALEPVTDFSRNQ